MNERIRELADEATELDYETFDQYNHKTVRHYKFDKEKFAQLIVRECIEQLVMEGDAWEQFSRNPPEGQENNASAALFAAYRLKEDAVARLEQHFGVEE
jgi:hypothetical protein